MLDLDEYKIPPRPSTSTSTNGNSDNNQLVGKKKRVNEGDSEEDLDELDGGEGHHHLGGQKNGKANSSRKRNRTALSCTECKRRKIKCDRKTPCEACCKRGEEDTCHWENPTAPVPPQPFTLVAEHEALKARVLQLEGIIEKYFQRQHDAPPPTSDVYQLRNVSHSRDLSYIVDSDPIDIEEPDEGTEEAALVLEELALGRKLTRVNPRKNSVVVIPPPILPPQISPPPIAIPRFVNEDFSAPPISAAMASLLVPPLLSPRQKLVLDEIWTTIPSSKTVLDFLISNYFLNTDWNWKLHHRPTFLVEYEAFSQLVSQGRRDEIDPLWLGIFCQTLCLSVNSLDSKIESPLVNITEQDLNSLPGQLFDAAQSCLEVGQWVGKPRIRTLQTIVLFAPFLLFDGSPSTGERHQTYLGAAIRIAQQLGLHKLGFDPTVMPIEDPALPSGINSMRREIPIRIFYTLLYLDYMGIRSKPSLTPNLIYCALPSNFNDGDLSSEGISTPRPEDESTDATFEIIKYKVALQQRRFSEIVASGLTLEYETITDLDKGYRSIMDTLPSDLRYDYEAPIGENLSSTWRRSMVTQTIANRMMRLHRPFMSRGYKDLKYRHSTTSALEAARQVLVCQQALNRAPLLKSGFQLLHVQGAVIVLLMNMWTEFPEELESNDDYRLMRESVPLYERSLTSRHIPVRKIASQNLQTISLLMDAFEERRNAAKARRAAGGTWASEVEAESYGKLLKRVGTIVISTATANNPDVPTTLSLSDRLASTATTSSLLPTSNNGMNSNLDPSLLPSHDSLAWTNPALYSSSGESDPTLMPTAYPTSITLSDFDLSSFSGPEYDTSFDWTQYDQFSALGNF